jgi:all-trans-retinol dehydrogenase (NAD+)
MSPLSILTAPIRLALFDPRVTTPLLIALLYSPENLQKLLPERVHPFITSQAVIRTLSVLLGWGVLRAVNRKLSQWTANNWKKDARFMKSQELVLISGGCSGIGKLMAEEFARRGVKVVVLDLNTPKSTLRKLTRDLSFCRWVVADGRKLPVFTSISAMSPIPSRLLLLLHRSAKSMASQRS